MIAKAQQQTAARTTVFAKTIWKYISAQDALIALCGTPGSKFDCQDLFTNFECCHPTAALILSGGKCQQLERNAADYQKLSPESMILQSALDSKSIE